MGTHWGVIVPDVIGACGVLVAGRAAWLSQQASRQAIEVSSKLTAIEVDRRNAERVPRMTARLALWGSGQQGFALSVWLETPEPLARIRVVVQEARNMDSPVGFKPGQDGVDTWSETDYEAEGLHPAWKTDALRPIADWQRRMAPGTAAVWIMDLRSTASMSGGDGGVRFKALAWAERDEQTWELPLPVTLTTAAIRAVRHRGGNRGPVTPG